MTRLEEARGGLERLPRRATLYLAQDRGVRHAVIVQVDGTGRGLCEAIPRLLPAGDDDDRRDVLPPERQRVIESEPKVVRGTAVVLRGAEHDDRVTVAVTVGGRRTLHESNADQQ